MAADRRNGVLNEESPAGARLGRMCYVVLLDITYTLHLAFSKDSGERLVSKLAVILLDVGISGGWIGVA